MKLKDLFKVSRCNDFDSLRMYLENGGFPDDVDEYGNTPLFQAIFNNSIECILLLIQFGANVNHRKKTGETPIFYCNENSCDILVKNGARINVCNENLLTPLHTVSEIGAMKILINLGINVNAEDKTGRTPLHHHIYDDINGISLLIDSGANINAIDIYGNTPLMLLAMAEIHSDDGFRSCINKADYLVNQGASINLKNNEGQGLVDIATKESGSTSYADYFKSVT